MTRALAESERTPEPRKTATSYAFLKTDRAIVMALRARNPAGGAALYDAYHRHVRRIVVRVLGSDAEVGDLVQEVFLSAIDSIDRLEEPEALRAWLSQIAVFRSRAEIRRRVRRRGFPLFAPAELPEVEAVVSSPEVGEAVRATYRVLDKLPADERIAFALRFVDGMELVEVADACSVSLATIKRRLARARQRFSRIAAEYGELADWVQGGTR